MITVGAAGATGDCTAGYRCDGTADDLVIGAALADAGAGETVELSTGRFTCADGFTIPKGVSLAGTPATVLRFTTDARREIVAKGRNEIERLDLRGPIMLTIRGSSVRCADLISHQVRHGEAAFRIYARDDHIGDVRFTDCTAINTSGHGFMIDAMYPEHPDPAVRHIAFHRCRAIGCGAAHDLLSPNGPQEWICGFVTEGGADLHANHITTTDCIAAGCYESGFHTEYAVVSENCRISRCLSVNNGVKPSPVYGSGYLLNPGWLAEDCVSIGNKRGFTVGTSIANSAHPVQLRRCTATAPAGQGFYINGYPGAPLTFVELDRCTVANTDAKRYLLLTDVQNARITDLRVCGCTGTVGEAGATTGTTITYDET